MPEQHSSNKVDLPVARLIETAISALVVASIVGAGGYFLAIPRIQDAVTGVKQDIQEVKIVMKEQAALEKLHYDSLDQRLRSVEIDIGRRNIHESRR